MKGFSRRVFSSRGFTTQPTYASFQQCRVDTKSRNFKAAVDHVDNTTTLDEETDEYDDVVDYTSDNFARQHNIYKDQFGDVQACPYGNITVAPLGQIPDESFPYSRDDMSDSSSVRHEHAKMRRKSTGPNPCCHLSTNRVVNRPFFNHKLIWNGKKGTFTEIYKIVTSWMIQCGMGYATMKDFKEAYIKGGTELAKQFTHGVSVPQMLHDSRVLFAVILSLCRRTKSGDRHIHKFEETQDGFNIWYCLLLDFHDQTRGYEITELIQEIEKLEYHDDYPGGVAAYFCELDRLKSKLDVLDPKFKRHRKETNAEKISYFEYKLKMSRSELFTPVSVMCLTREHHIEEFIYRLRHVFGEKSSKTKSSDSTDEPSKDDYKQCLEHILKLFSNHKHDTKVGENIVESTNCDMGNATTVSKIDILESNNEKNCNDLKAHAFNPDFYLPKKAFTLLHSISPELAEKYDAERRKLASSRGDIKPFLAPAEDTSENISDADVESADNGDNDEDKSSFSLTESTNSAFDLPHDITDWHLARQAFDLDNNEEIPFVSGNTEEISFVSEHKIEIDKSNVESQTSYSSTSSEEIDSITLIGELKNELSQLQNAHKYGIVITDSGNNMGVCGNGWKLLHNTGEIRKLTSHMPGNTGSYLSVGNFAAVARDINLRKVLLIYNQGLWNKSCKHSMTSDFQIRNNGNIIDSLAKTHFSRQGYYGDQCMIIKSTENCYDKAVIPLLLRQGCMCFEIREPKDSEMISLPRYEMTSSKRWLPNHFNDPNEFSMIPKPLLPDLPNALQKEVLNFLILCMKPENRCRIAKLDHECLEYLLKLENVVKKSVMESRRARIKGRPKNKLKECHNYEYMHSNDSKHELVDAKLTCQHDMTKVSDFVVRNAGKNLLSLALSNDKKIRNSTSSTNSGVNVLRGECNNRDFMVSTVCKDSKSCILHDKTKESKFDNDDDKRIQGKRKGIIEDTYDKCDSEGFTKNKYVYGIIVFAVYMAALLNTLR